MTKEPSDITIKTISWPWDKGSENGRLVEEYCRLRSEAFLRMYGQSKYSGIVDEHLKTPNARIIVALVGGKVVAGGTVMFKPRFEHQKLNFERSHKLRVSELFPHLETDNLIIAEAGGMFRLPEYKGGGIIPRIHGAQLEAMRANDTDIMVATLTPKNVRGILSLYNATRQPYVVRDDLCFTGIEGLPRTLLTVAINPDIPLRSAEMERQGTGVPPPAVHIIAKYHGHHGVAEGKQ